MEQASVPPDEATGAPAALAPDVRQLLPLFRGDIRKGGVYAGPRLVLEYHVTG